MLKLFDTYTESLIALPEDHITIYNCGPTVYNHIHIGNARPLVTFDVLYRLLLLQGRDVHYVLNITDIDDKIIKEAQFEGIPELVLSEKYFQEYKKIKEALNTLPMTNPKVSDHIPEIVQFIADLVAQEAAYVVDGDVYFDTSKVANYGQLAKRNPEELLAGARVEADPKKRHPNDFVLWKRTNVGINWETPWSKGRPGWHTECVVLVNKFFGDHATIHGGGMDLKFPHHENENAQNNAHNGRNLADIWLHIGLININQQKMSKSLNNFILVKDILQIYPYQVLRWFFYQGSVANPLNYSQEQMELLREEVNRLEHTLAVARTWLILNNIPYHPADGHNRQEVAPALLEALENNLNFPNAVTEIQRLSKQVNLAIRQKAWAQLGEAYQLLLGSLNLLGITFPDYHDEVVKAKLRRWQQLNEAQNYTESDQLRDELKAFF